MSALLDLAERCEKAEGPDNSLDVLVDCARFEADEHVVAMRSNAAGTKVICTNADGSESTHWAPDYTASLDAALTLVPEGWDWLRLDPCSMTVYAPANNKDWAQHTEARAATPALALTAACLRARHSMEGLS